MNSRSLSALALGFLLTVGCTYPRTIFVADGQDDTAAADISMTSDSDLDVPAADVQGRDSGPDVLAADTGLDVLTADVRDGGSDVVDVSTDVPCRFGDAAVTPPGDGGVPTPRSFGSICTIAGDCDSNLCDGGHCSAACRTSCDCPSLSNWACAPATGGSVCHCTPTTPRTEVCDGIDNDCDGIVDNGVNTQTDPANCGACRNSCPTRSNSARACATSMCGFTCNAGFGDCDSMPITGCETRTSDDITNCGACGTVCPTPANAAPSCAAGVCGITCSAGFSDCDSTASTGCEARLVNDVANCGACGNGCPTRANSMRTCAASTCGITCNAGFADCDSLTATGCETRTSDQPTNCGGCGIVCPARANASQTCTGGVCGFACNTGFANCDGASANGCEVNLGSPSSCGACGMACPVRPNTMAATCTGGTCGTGPCLPGFSDCDGNPLNGCEANLNSGATCGSCSNVCALDNNCNAGACVVCTPTVVLIPQGAAPPPPAGMGVRCFDGPSTFGSVDCPVVQCGRLNTWAFSYNDNRFSLGVVTYTPAGAVYRSTEQPGARYLWSTVVNSGPQTVTFSGQASNTVTIPWSQLRL